MTYAERLRACLAETLSYPYEVSDDGMHIRVYGGDTNEVFPILWRARELADPDR